MLSDGSNNISEDRRLPDLVLTVAISLVIIASNVFLAFFEMMLRHEASKSLMQCTN
jgi:hypothetical protein